MISRFVTTLEGCILGVLLHPAFSSAQQVQIQGRWSTPLGVVRITQQGNKVTGKIIWPSKICRFRKGERILKGILLEDSLSGQWRYCLKGTDCDSDGWALAVMLVARGGSVMSGASHVKSLSKNCQVNGVGKGKGLVLRRLKPKPLGGRGRFQKKENAHQNTSGPKHKDALANAGEHLIDEQGRPLEAENPPLQPEIFRKSVNAWRANMEKGNRLMENGFFEGARKSFILATKMDPTRPEAFNGIGVTYYARGDYEEALRWYKKSLEVNPDFPDAYYNMACIYSILRKKEMALRYLEISVLNGFVDVEAAKADQDLTNVHAEPKYQELIRLMAKSQ